MKRADGTGFGSTGGSGFWGTGGFSGITGGFGGGSFLTTRSVFFSSRVRGCFFSPFRPFDRLRRRFFLNGPFSQEPVLSSVRVRGRVSVSASVPVLQPVVFRWVWASILVASTFGFSTGVGLGFATCRILRDPVSGSPPASESAFSPRRALVPEDSGPSEAQGAGSGGPSFPEQRARAGRSKP